MCQAVDPRGWRCVRVCACSGVCVFGSFARALLSAANVWNARILPQEVAGLCTVSRRNKVQNCLSART